MNRNTAHENRANWITSPALGAEQVPPRDAHSIYRMTKRVFDLVVALLGIGLLSPVFLIVASLIKIESRGPVLFKQTRVGLARQPIQIWKFRKMRNDLPTQGPMLTMQNDRRMTRVGKFLERTKLDELPQLFNVVRGDMSIVGPRPEVPKFIEYYPEKWDDVLSVKPGIFGASQNHFRDESKLYPPREENIEAYYIRSILPVMLELDIAYVRRRGMAVDVGLLLQGIARVLFH